MTEAAARLDAAREAVTAVEGLQAQTQARLTALDADLATLQLRAVRGDVEATQAIAEAEQAQWQAHRTLTVQLPQAPALARPRWSAPHTHWKAPKPPAMWPSTTVSPRKKTA